MGYDGAIATIPLTLTGFNFARDSKLEFQTSLVEGTRNINYHEGGLGKRGGTSKVFASPITGNPFIRGLYQFRESGGTNYMVFAGSDGKVYNNTEANVIKTGMSANNYFNFSVFDNTLYIADGATVPQTWVGGAASTVDITGVPTDWSATSDYPFQIVAHARGSNARMWAIRRDAVYASKNNDGQDFSDGEVKKIPIYSDGGLVGGFDFGGNLFVFSKTQTFIIDDTDSDSTTWGFKEAIWEGGVAHWRLITKAGNELFLMTTEGNIYSLRGVQATGDYVKADLTRPSHIDRFFQNEVTLSNILNFHAAYDKKLRAIKWFVQVDGTDTNTALNQFIDRPPEIAWVIHDNTDNPSGYNASISAPYEETSGQLSIRTGDFNGDIWKLESTSQVDDTGVAYKGSMKTKIIDFKEPRMFKHFRFGRIRASAEGNFDLTIRIWVDGDRKADIPVTVSGSGAVFGDALLGTAVFGEDNIDPKDFELGYYGFNIQIEIFNENANEDFFITELLLMFKRLGQRT